MKLALLLAMALAALTTTSALADVTELGKAGKKKDAKRTIQITMNETADGKMAFFPGKLDFKEGETVILSFTNTGKTDHEFVMDSDENVQKHREVMKKNPDMVHADDNTIRVEPGKKGVIIWKFAKAGEYKFACMIPGHYEAGMSGPLKVTGKAGAAMVPAEKPAASPVVASSEATAGPLTAGLVKKLDAKQMKVTIKHGKLVNLDMDAMTMVFAVKDEAMMKKLKEGADIKFKADRVNGQLTVVELN